MEYILFSVIWFVGVLWLDVSSDYKKWKENIPIKHTKEMVVRCLLLTPSALGFWLFNFSLVSLPIIIVMEGAWYWEFF